MEREGASEYGRQLAEEYPDEAIEIEDRPEDAEFAPGNDLYLRAFRALMHDRGASAMGTPLPIPYVAISQYARDNDIPADEFETFVAMVRALDEEWLGHLMRKTAAGKPPAPQHP